MTILFKVEDFTRKIYKVTGSQDDGFAASRKCPKTASSEISTQTLGQGEGYVDTAGGLSA